MFGNQTLLCQVMLPMRSCAAARFEGLVTKDRCPGELGCLPDSEHIEPFVDVVTFFPDKCPHKAFPAHIEKQMLFRGECPQFVYPPLTGGRSNPPWVPPC